MANPQAEPSSIGGCGYFATVPMPFKSSWVAQGRFRGTQKTESHEGLFAMSFIITPPDPDHGGSHSSYIDQMENGSRGPLRHFLIGTPQRIRATIRHLHARRYAEVTDWSQLLRLGEDGLLIRPTPREVYAYLQRPERLD